MELFYRVATLPGNMEKPGIWQFKQKKTWKTLNFEQQSLKNLDKSEIFNNFYILSS